VNRSCIFCMFGMTLSRPLLTMQLTSSADVFTHVCRQKADTWSNYCDNIQPFEKIIFCFCKMWQFLHCFFWKLPQIRTSNFRKVMQQHTEGMMVSIIWVCRKFISLSRSWKILKISYELTKLSPWVCCTTFWDTVDITCKLICGCGAADAADAADRPAAL